jgi:hypothetical protein
MGRERQTRMRAEPDVAQEVVGALVAPAKQRLAHLVCPSAPRRRETGRERASERARERARARARAREMERERDRKTDRGAGPRRQPIEQRGQHKLSSC